MAAAEEEAEVAEAPEIDAPLLAHPVRRTAALIAAVM